MTKTSLQGLSIINTRPEHQAEPLNLLLQALGARTINLPTLQISPANSDKTQKLCNQLDTIDIAIFVSANAAHCSHNYWPKPFPVPSVIAIGPGTAKTLENYGLKEIIVPAEFNSEGILKLETLQNVSGKRIIIFCGKNPRAHLQISLQEQGADIVMCECYERTAPTANPETLSNLENHPAQGLISTSKESLKNLDALITEHHLTLKTLPIIVISPGMMSLAQDMGWERIILASNASDSAIIEATSKLMPI